MVNSRIRFKGHWYTFKGDNSVKIVLLHSEKVSTQKGNNLLPLE